MHPFTESLQKHFEAHRNREKAEPMERYMKNHFPFLGIQTPERKQLFREVSQNTEAPKGAELPVILRELWALPEREFQMLALTLLDKYRKHLKETHLPLLEELITTKSWWDSVDMLASHFVGLILAAHPHLIEPYVQKWMASNNMWLQRTCLLFQLKYKEKTDMKLLFSLIEQLSHSKEFFIQKAIGWVLREYAKTNPKAVWEFVQTHHLAPLSKREAIKHIKNVFEQ
ncbi:DNA alkylation repair protein [Bacillus sp. AFS018417]|uniref:DNA alkylation repair protein n=1 Tax=Bacillus sp. AFS018417 TaxID=2033491 RepID=UPI000BF7A864|nr:DNA alkylation repair protein [Bacillus sp. AFS018417]PEZ06055.1 DNA alkylation repair protein [Bacillus sp. AFS018417]